MAEWLSPALVAMGSVRRLGTRLAEFRAFGEADTAFLDALAERDDGMLAAYVEGRVSYARLRRTLGEQARRALVHPVLLRLGADRGRRRRPGRRDRGAPAAAARRPGRAPGGNRLQDRARPRGAEGRLRPRVLRHVARPRPAPLRRREGHGHRRVRPRLGVAGAVRRRGPDRQGLGARGRAGRRRGSASAGRAAGIISPRRRWRRSSSPATRRTAGRSTRPSCSSPSRTR